MVHEGDAWVLPRHAWVPLCCALLHQIDRNLSALGMFLVAFGRRLWAPGRGLDALMHVPRAYSLDLPCRALQETRISLGTPGSSAGYSGTSLEHPGIFPGHPRTSSEIPSIFLSHPSTSTVYPLRASFREHRDLPE